MVFWNRSTVQLLAVVLLLPHQHEQQTPWASHAFVARRASLSKRQIHCETQNLNQPLQQRTVIASQCLTIFERRVRFPLTLRTATAGPLLPIEEDEDEDNEEGNQNEYFAGTPNENVMNEELATTPLQQQEDSGDCADECEIDWSLMPGGEGGQEAEGEGTGGQNQETMATCLENGKMNQNHNYSDGNDSDDDDDDEKDVSDWTAPYSTTTTTTPEELPWTLQSKPSSKKSKNSKASSKGRVYAGDSVVASSSSAAAQQQHLQQAYIRPERSVRQMQLILEMQWRQQEAAVECDVQHPQTCGGAVCDSCHGDGYKACRFCHGTAVLWMRPSLELRATACPICHQGIEMCHTCKGSGWIAGWTQLHPEEEEEEKQAKRGEPYK